MKSKILMLVSNMMIAAALTGGAQVTTPKLSFDSERWMTFYYENPQPEKTFDAIRAIHDEGLLLLPDAQQPLIAFFSTIFSDNPSVTTQLLARCTFLSEKEMGVLAYAFWFADTDDSKAQLKALSDKDKNYAPFLKSPPPSIIESEITIPNSLDMCWGHFFASGNTQYVGKVIEVLENKNNKTDPAKILVYGSARWSLASNCRQHKKVLAYCRSAVFHLPETSKAEVQSILDEIDGKVVPASVEEETVDKLKQIKKESGWQQKGEPVLDTDNIKSKNGFGAQLWVITDKSFFDDWNKPEAPKVPITKTALRNKPVYIIFFFINPGLDQQSKANVTADVTIKSPDGNIYGDFKDIEVWKRIYRSAPNSIQLAIGNLGLKIEDGEQLGIYSVEAKIKDHIKKTTLELNTDFTAKDQ